MAPKAAEKSAASAAQSHEGFSSPTHLAFSSFSHITDMPTLTMSVGLREDEKKTEEWVAKIILKDRELSLGLLQAHSL